MQRRPEICFILSLSGCSYSFSLNIFLDFHGIANVLFDRRGDRAVAAFADNTLQHSRVSRGIGESRRASASVDGEHSTLDRRNNLRESAQSGRYRDGGAFNRLSFHRSKPMTPSLVVSHTLRRVCQTSTQRLLIRRRRRLIRRRLMIRRRLRRSAFFSRRQRRHVVASNRSRKSVPVVAHEKRPSLNDDAYSPCRIKRHRRSD